MYIIKQNRGRFTFSALGPSIRGSCNVCSRQAARGVQSTPPPAAAAASSARVTHGASSAAASNAPVTPASSTTPSAAAAAAAPTSAPTAPALSLSAAVAAAGAATGSASVAHWSAIRLDRDQLQELRKLASPSLKNSAQLGARIDAIEAGRESAQPADGALPADSRWFVIACPRCRNVGIALVSSERQSLANNNLRSRQINRDPMVHARRRLYVTYVVLRAIDEAAQNRRLSAEATVRCIAASQQEIGAGGGEYQDAHQLLREVAIGNDYTYDCVEASRKTAIMLCHGVVSHLEARYNNADNGIEEAIADAYVRLVTDVVDGQLRRTSTSARSFRELLWRGLCGCYLGAIQTALGTAVDEDPRNVLAMYEAIAKHLLHEPPTYVFDETDQLCASIAAEFVAIS
jgi:hypothetical protein